MDHSHSLWYCSCLFDLTLLFKTADTSEASKAAAKKKKKKEKEKEKKEKDREKKAKDEEKDGKKKRNKVEAGSCIWSFVYFNLPFSKPT